MNPEIEKILFVPNKIPAWVEKHKDKLNKLVYKSLKKQNRLYEVAMQKMLFGSLSKDLQEQIIKEAKKELSGAQEAPASGGEAAAGGGGASPETVLFQDGMVPAWIERYRKHFNSMVYKSLKSQGKLEDAQMQKMLFGTLSQELQEKIQKEVKAAKAKQAAAAAPAGATTGGDAGGAQVVALLQKISSQLEEILKILKERSA